jgi:hypothetical protein
MMIYNLQSIKSIDLQSIFLSAQEEDEIEGLPIEYLLGHGRLEHSQSGTGL